LGAFTIRTVAQFIRTHKYAWLALYFVVFVTAFFIIEKTSPTEGYWVTDLPVDEKIPFIPQFIVFYVLWYPLFVAVGVPLLIWDGEAFKRYMYFTMAGLSLSLLIDVLVPNGQNLRPADMPVTGFSTWLLSKIWGADTNTNVFPSMHIVGAIGAVIGAFDSGIFRKWRWVILVFAVLISASTVFVKQHAVLDIAGAVALSVPVAAAVYCRRFFGKREKL
jgi:membrane-associated phospholipid phosphatase